MKNDIYEKVDYIIDDVGSVYIYGMKNGQEIFETIYNEIKKIYSCKKIDGNVFVDDCKKLDEKEIRNKYFGSYLTYFISNVDNIFCDKKALVYLLDLVELEENNFIMLANKSLSDYSDDIRVGLSFLEEVCTN